MDSKFDERDLDKLTRASNWILQQVPEHFQDGCINLTSLAEATKEMFPATAQEFNLDKLVENVGFMIQEKAQQSGKCMLEVVKSITVTNPTK